MTSAPPMLAPPGRQLNAVFLCAKRRGAFLRQTGIPIPGRRPGRIARTALASTVVVGLGSLSAGCATAGDGPELAARAAEAPVNNTALPSAGHQLAPGIILASTNGARRGARTAAVERRDIDSPRAACLDAVRQAEAKHGIPEGLMVAVALAESGLHAHAMNIGGRSYFPDGIAEARRIYNGARPGQYVMAGCVQVNARVHARNSDWPLDPWRAADWGAGYLRQHYDRMGNWADAIRRWNGGGASGDRLACRVMGQLKVTNPGSTALDGTRCGGTAIARERRNGEQLLEVAEAAD